METKFTPVYGIKGKLVSAVCMLLVAVIMVVSSTYAWFTLSTAPEITGITTTVGANGALEMLLATKQNGTWVYNEGVLASNDWTTKNTYWGNLVDVSDNTVYGINDLKLYPATLNLANSTTLSSASFLQIPSYGPDGRVSELMPNTVTGTYNTSSRNFYLNDGYGVRAVGVASGMTDRQYAYRNLLADAQTDMASAKNLAAQSLNDNGSTLANVALKKATQSNATYNAADVAAVQEIVDDLLKVDGVLDTIESAYLNYVYAFAASSLVTGDNDLAYTAVQNYFGGDIDKLYAIVAPVEEGETREQGKLTVTLGDASGTSFTATLPAELYGPLNTLKATREDVEKADAMLETLATATAGEATVEWSTGATHDGATIGIGTALTLLADTEGMEINGVPAREVKDRMSEIVNSVSGKGLTVTMKTNGGVYADIADHCGDYSVSITIEKVQYGTLVLENMNARMNTASTVLPSYLTVINSAVANNAPTSQGASGGMPLTEFYGYVIDLAFKTNAANSNLLLEINGADRIYEDNMPGTDTQGGGSRMTFTRAETATDMTDDQIKNLMRAARIVFFDPDTYAVYAFARLDVDHAITTAGGIIADINLVKEFDGVKVGETVYGLDSDGNLLRVGANQLPTLNDVAYWRVEEEGVVKYYATKTPATTEGGEDTYSNELETAPVSAHVTVLLSEQNSVIRSLTANEAAHVSALVYLDGNLIGNDDVTAIGTTSVTMKMNLQFRSDATLVPMTDGNLHKPLETETP